ncbi:MAG: hypothetical protein HMLKMBBP_00100 [Planctomycetes bacterium]|nr:hypothetical protein [Planctomycetota bacterium]
MFRARNFASALVLAHAALAGAGCQGLAQALGVQPVATAPVIEQHFTQVANRGPGSIDDVDSRAGQEANGDVGASGSGTAGQTATQTTTNDPEAVAQSAVELLKTAPVGSPAALLADAALAEVVGGDPRAADRLIRRAKAAHAADRKQVGATPQGSEVGPSSPGTDVPPAK